MCGINGFISLAKCNDDDRNILKSKIETMNDSIFHRGPDSGGVHIQTPIIFGFRRLSIIDLKDSANQPMVSDDENLVLVFNGEIYNYIELKEDLISRGYKFRTSSDTEVILKGFEEYGDQCVQRFNGMWAFAIYDFKKERLFCSRDRLGVKPFYYSVVGNELFFSSELKAIHAATGQTKANLQRVYQYLAYGYRMNDEETFFENCSELQPGTNLIIKNGKISTEKYWTLTKNMYAFNDNPDYHTEYEELFKSAVKLRYRSDVPVALLLSGGLDSTAIARVTDDLIESGELPPTDIHAFIASFPGFEDDETEIAREFIKTCKHIKLHEIRMDEQSISEGFEELIYGLDHPLFSFNTIVHNRIMKECKKRKIKVVINGQGADEAIAGYVRYISGVVLVDKFFSKGDFTKELKALNKNNGFSNKFLVSQMFKAMLNPSKAAYLRARYQEKILSFLNKDFVSSIDKKLKTDYKFSCNGQNLENYLLDKINNQGLNMILHYEDVSSMNQSIEIRSPFMDYRLMEFSFSIPSKLKFNNGITKVILRETIGKSLPDSITKNRKKIGFSTPFTDFLTEDTSFNSYINEVLKDTSFKSKKIWDSKKLSTVFKNPSEHPQFPFWRIINLEVWSKMYGITNL
ncbi:Asparagine synthetase [glutamine-hydrolyzing] [hydrothermal vent metagenome]|uniref:Asparagine synthetase [glutamine-hydrolyzing] n=1 Tax=hydrothermal vent metagenome TaxID=652676 RepID=A0A3B0TVZ9_9ZZZZ